MTTSLGMVSKWLLILLMFIGRVGSITFLIAFSSDKNRAVSRLPVEKIQVG